MLPCATTIVLDDCIEKKHVANACAVYCRRAANVALESQEDQSDALHDLYCRTRSEAFGDEVQVGECFVQCVMLATW